jgi:hypothetical protein
MDEGIYASFFNIRVRPAVIFSVEVGAGVEIFEPPFGAVMLDRIESTIYYFRIS